MNATVPHTVRDRAAWADLRELDEHGEGLTQWEIDWVESVTKHLLQGRHLSPAQWTTLNRIREERL